MSSVSVFASRGRTLRATFAGVAVSFGCLLAGAQPAAAATEALIYSFKQFPDAIEPDFGLVKGPDGNFYGATRLGGAGPGLGNGAIYQLKPPTVGHPAWTESVIWNFKGGTKGKYPSGPLIFGTDGKAYGVAHTGGDLTDCNGQGCGIAYSIALPLAGKKLGVFKVIHNFHSLVGSSPTGALTFDSAGNLYGSTMYGGGDNYCTGDKGGCGVIYRLNPPAMGKVAWPQTTLYRFQHAVGAVPNGALVFNQSETTLFGTGQGGGTSSLDGVAFSLSKPTPGHMAWGYSVLHNFLGVAHSEGSQPNSGLTFDSSGNLYGTTQYGGSNSCNDGCGVVFKLSLSGGVWSMTNTRVFQGGSNDGRNPLSGLVYDGNSLYGTTQYGAGSGCGNGCGTVFKIGLTTPSYFVLHSFQNVPTDGIVPTYATLLLDGTTLYGTTSAGGQPFYGTAFSVTLP